MHIVDIVDIPTSISVKWESDPEFPPSHISSATQTGNNEFELDGLPLGQAGSMCGEVFVRLERLGGESEGGVRVISRVGLTVGQ